jgi:atypical dual specificity phosphatase
MMVAAKKGAEPILILSDFGVAFDERIVLTGVNLTIEGPGVHVVMGPGGTGKSTLLRTVCGMSQALASFRSWGEASCLGSPLAAEKGPALVGQNARLLMSSVMENIISELPNRGELTLAAKREVAKQLLTEAGLDSLLDSINQPVVQLPLAVQRHLAIARTAASDPPLLCIDEPTADLEAEECEPLLRFIKQQGEKRGVLVVSHKQLDAKQLDGHVVLLAGGTVRAHEEAKPFFEEPSSPLTTDFVRTGSCSLPSPDAKPEDIDESMHAYLPILPEEATNYVRESLGPRGFLWAKKGKLAGTPRPGIVQDIDYDLEALKRVGVTVLVSLTTKPVDPEQLETYGIQGIWMPIKDMHAPGLEEAEAMCRKADAIMRGGGVVAYHCRAGLGRTGTMLASHLILEGLPALEALESIRRIEPRWVQSDVQVKFLERFCDYLRGRQKKPSRQAKAKVA